MLEMLLIKSSNSDDDSDYLRFYNSDNMNSFFICHLEDGGYIKAFSKLLNTIGMEVLL